MTHFLFLPQEEHQGAAEFVPPGCVSRSCGSWLCLGVKIKDHIGTYEHKMSLLNEWGFLNLFREIGFPNTLASPLMLSIAQHAWTITTTSGRANGPSSYSDLS